MEWFVASLFHFVQYNDHFKHSAGTIQSVCEQQPFSSLPIYGPRHVNSTSSEARLWRASLLRRAINGASKTALWRQRFNKSTSNASYDDDSELDNWSQLMPIRVLSRNVFWGQKMGRGNNTLGSGLGTSRAWKCEWASIQAHLRIRQCLLEGKNFVFNIIFCCNLERGRGLNPAHGHNVAILPVLAESRKVTYR